MLSKINSNFGDGQISFSVVDGEPYVKVGADAPRPFNKGSEFIAMTIFHGASMTTSDTMCEFAAYNPDVISYDPNTCKITLKKSCKIAVYMSHTPVGISSNVTVSYKINENPVSSLITSSNTNKLETGEISVQKDDSITFYYRSSINTRHFIAIELHSLQNNSNEL